MWVRIGLGAALGLTALAGAGSGASAQALKKPPYWASIAKGEAVMRVGPSRNFPASWVYMRRNLPVRVIETYPDWRKVEDPDGTVGWFHVRLLKDDRMGIVKGGEAELRDRPSTTARLLYRLAPGVVGKLSGCANGWCAFEAEGKSGYVLGASLWGPTER
ncbi:MAG TPA: SH3 domain-containing protein [Sphingobium sp.]|nr:SH3 domain-containing protein [Sphingobium sp.]